MNDIHIDSSFLLLLIILQSISFSCPWMSRNTVPSTQSDVNNFCSSVFRFCATRVCVGMTESTSIFIFKVGLCECRFFKNILFACFWTVLNIDYSVISLESLPQLHVHSALNVHKKKSSGKADGHHHQFSPKGPL